jgi:sortase A
VTTPVSNAEGPPPCPGSTAASAASGADRRRGRTARLARFAGSALVVLGVGMVAWTIVVWQWQDPFTALYTLYQQHELTGRYHRIAESYRPLLVQQAEKAKAASGPTSVSPAARVATERRLVRADARRYRNTLDPGTPLGRIKVPRLGLSILVVTGTDHDSLTKGPGWDQRSYLPGAGELIYIAGHRTTYLAPFAHIDSMRTGDLVTIEVPYGTFVYRVRSHVIVPSDDLSRLRSYDRPAGVPAGEVIALQACHPRFFATQRYIVYAVLVHVAPRGGKPYDPRE